VKWEFNKFATAVTSEEEFSTTTTKLLSLFFLTVAFILSLMSYDGGAFLYFIPKSSIIIRPDFISSGISLTLLTPLYARGILRWSKSAYGMVMFILFWSVFASIFQLGLVGSVGNVSKYLISAAVLISWIGIRGLAGAAWTLALAAAIYNLISTSSAIGMWGFIFLCCTFLGLLLHSNLSPATFSKAILEEYSSTFRSSADKIKNDFPEYPDN
jgi:hypothetical protein